MVNIPPKPSVEVLTQAVELLVLIGAKALLEPVITVAVRSEHPRPGPPEMGLLLPKKLRAVFARELQKAVFGNVDPYFAVDEGGLGDLYVRTRVLRRTEQGPGKPLKDLALGYPDPDRVVTPGFYAETLVADRDLQ